MKAFHHAAARLLGGIIAACGLWVLPAAAQAQGGACCLPSGHCVHRTEAECTAFGGTFQGNGIHCSTVQCPQATGACCILSSTGIECQVLTFQQCRQQSGHYRGHGTDCTTHPCPLPRGACCLPNGRCVQVTEANCTLYGGTFKGGLCSAANCPGPTGACCIPDAASGGFTCQELSAQDCRAQEGHYRGNGTDCTTHPCPSRGACCLPGGRCIQITEAMCTTHGGTFHGGLCSAANCPQPTGACCIPDPATGGFTCEELKFRDCRAQNGHYRGHGTECATHPCPPPRGACCVGQMCVMTFEQPCLHHNGTWQGSGVLCSPDPCGRAVAQGQFSPELIADFNGDGRVDVADAVAFMNSYAAGDADMDGDGVTDRRDLMLFIENFLEATRR